MLREYETIFILRPDISDVDTDRVTERLKNAIRSEDGRILEVKNWGKRRLAYEIAHNQKGIYLYWRYAGNNRCVAELERILRMLEPVLRFLTVKLEDQVDPALADDIGDEAIPLRVGQGRPEDQYFQATLRDQDEGSPEDAEPQDADSSDDETDDEPEESEEDSEDTDEETPAET